MKRVNLILMMMFGVLSAFAQGGAEAEDAQPIIPEPSIGLSTTELLIVALLIFAFILLFVSITLYNSFKVIYNEQKNPTPYVNPKDRKLQAWDEDGDEDKPTIWTKLLSLKPLSQEKDLEIPHAYDGIKELNNPIPTWFNVLFLATLIFAGAYLYYYHIAEYGQRQDDEYNTEVAKADFEKQKFLAKSGSAIDENSVKIDPSQIVAGKTIYDGNCVACHGVNGEGLVGPNLTDEFWIHGGDVKAIFKTIKYGVPEKGMVSWEKNMSAVNISAVTNYILSLQGSNPANAKAPQGDKYTPEAAASIGAVN